MSATAPLGWQSPALAGLSVAQAGGLAASYAGWLLDSAGAEVVRLDLEGAPAYSGAEAPEFRRAVEASLESGVRRQRVWSLGGWLDAHPVDVLIVDNTGLPRAERGRVRRELREVVDVGTVICLIEPGRLTSSRGDDDAEWSELAAMSASGFLSLGGYPDEVPASVNGHLASCSAGAQAAAAIAVQLVARARSASLTGPTRVVVDATECLLPALETALQFWHSEGIVRKRRGAVIEAGQGTFRCGDGFVNIVAAGFGDLAWQRFCDWFEQLGGDDTFRQPEWRERPYRISAEGVERFTQKFEAVVGSYSRQELVDSGQRLKVPVAGVNQLNEVLDDSQLRHRKAWLAGGDSVRLAGPYRVSQVPSASDRGRGHPAHRSGIAGGSSADLPLAGLRVLDFTWVGAGPFTTRMLSDLGADVVKIESSGRLDPLRTSPPFADGVPGVDRSAYFANRNAGKRTISVDLKHPSAAQVVGRLAEQCDVVINSFGAGVLARLGFASEFFRDRRPSVVHVDMPLHGRTGPSAGHIGFGGMINAAGGYHALSRFDDRPPCGTGTNYPDHVPNPLHTLFALLVGVLAQIRDNSGVDVEVSQFESGIAFLAPELTYASRGSRFTGGLNTIDHTFPRGLFACADERLLAVEVVTPQQWSALCELLGDPGLDPSWTLERRQQQAADVRDAVASFCAALDVETAERRLQESGVPSAVVRDAADVGRTDAIWADGSVKTLRSEGFGEVLYTCLPLTIDDRRFLPARGAPHLGAHTTEVLAEWAGLSAERIRELDEEGVLR